MAPPPPPLKAAQLPTLLLADSTAWSTWLTTHAPTSPGTWLILAKKGTTSPTTLTYPQALDEALCHGWIDGQRRSRAEDGGATMLQRFTPRRPRSAWSKANVGHVERLVKEGRMREGGLREVERARGDGRWEGAYAGAGELGSLEGTPEGLRRGLVRASGAWGRWEGLGRGERYAVVLRFVGLRTEKGRREFVGRVVEGLVKGEGESVAVEDSGGKRGGSAVFDREGVDSEPAHETRAERAERRSKRAKRGS